LSVWLFVRYLGSGRLRTLVAAGLSAALLFSVKDYYVLILGCYGLAVLTRQGSWRQRLGRLGVLAGCVVAGVALPCLLHLWESGRWTRGVVYARAYSEGAVGTGFDLGHVLKLNYLHWLVSDSGVGGSGVLYLLGVCFLLLKARGDGRARLLALAAGAFLAFLSFMPVGFRPLRFIEQQPRYLLPVEPLLAVGAGGALAALIRSCPDAAARRAALAFLALFCLLQARSANLSAPVLYGRHTVGAGVRGGVAQARAHGLHTVVLPSSFEQVVPDSYRRLGCELVYAAPGPDFAGSALPLGEIEPYLDREGVGVYVPACLRVQEPKQYDRAVRMLAGRGYRPVEIHHVRSSTDCWKVRLGLRPDPNAGRRQPLAAPAAEPPETLVGHLYVREGG